MERVGAGRRRRMNRGGHDNRIWLGIVLMAAGGLAAALLHRDLSTANLDRVALEFFKYALFTVAIGGVLLLWKTLREQDEARAETRASHREEVGEFRNKIFAAYVEVKAVRRKLRAHGGYGGSGQFEIAREPYFELMDELNDAQLSLELIRRKLQADDSFLGALQEDVAERVRKAETFLVRVIDDFERYDHAAKPDPVVFTSGDQTYEFLRRNQSGAAVREQFFLPMQELNESLLVRLSRLG